MHALDDLAILGCLNVDTIPEGSALLGVVGHACRLETLCLVARSSHALVAPKVLIVHLLLPVRSCIISHYVFIVSRPFVTSSAEVDGSARFFHVVPGHWISSCGFRSSREAHDARLYRRLRMTDLVMVLYGVLLLQLLHITEFVLLRGFEAGPELIPDVLIWEIGVRRHCSVESGGEIAAFVQIFITHDLPVLIVELLPHPEHARVRAPAAGSWPS